MHRETIVQPRVILRALDPVTLRYVGLDSCSTYHTDQISSHSFRHPILERLGCVAELGLDADRGQQPEEVLACVLAALMHAEDLNGSSANSL